jgi:hypothetical protein
MSIPLTLRGWTFVTGAGTSAEAIAASGPQVAVPFERLQMAPSTLLAGVISVFNRFVDRVDSATRGSRSYPFGAGGTVLVAASFTSGQTLTAAHRLGTANVSPLGWCRSGTAGFGSFAVSSDGNSVIFTPNATFVADVFITAGI